MYPKIKFTYSWIYDRIWKNSLDREKKPYPPRKTTLDFLKKIKKLWKRDEMAVLKEISKVSGLKWSQKNIECFIVGRCIPFSQPLTMPVLKEYPDYFMETLTHELIHRIFIEENNLKRAEGAWDYFHKKYGKETLDTRIHIPLFAIFREVCLAVFNEKRLRRSISLDSEIKDYEKAWSIVQDEGAEKVIKEFKKRLKPA